MADIQKVRINDVLESQIPEFLNDESPLFKEFLKSYYNSLENKSGAVDLAENIKEYKDIDAFSIDQLGSYSIVTEEVYALDSEIKVQSTVGWPAEYGLLKIDDEIITYKSKTDTSFLGCSRGFSGIDKIRSDADSQFLEFKKSEAFPHAVGSVVTNLSNIFLLEFFKKFKSEFLPGFESRTFVDGLSIQNILSKAKDFYVAKGTDTSYKILFKILYGKNIEIIKPQDYTLVPSSNSYFITKNMLVEKLDGDDATLTKGNFLYQEITGVGTVSASIFNVEYRPVYNKEFYEISLDSTSFSGSFEVSGKTKVLEKTLTGSTTILVDSTIGFSKSGILRVKPQNSNYITLTYTDTSINQFLGVSGITKDLDYALDIVEDKFAYSYIGVGNTSRVDFRVINVIDNVDFSETSNLRVNDKVRLSGFGRDLTSNFRFNGWIYNLPTNHNIKDISQQSATNYRINLYDEISFFKGETIELSDGFGNLSPATVVSVEFNAGDVVRKFASRILVQVTSPTFTTTNAKVVKKVIIKSKHHSDYFPNISQIPCGVQNTYIDFDRSSFYVASSGLPTFEIFAKDSKTGISVDTNITSETTENIIATDHPFSTGDSVYYSPSDTSNSGIKTGYYFLTKIDDDNIKLSYSKNDVFFKKYIQVKPGNFGDVIYRNGYENKELKNQKIFKKFNIVEGETIFDDKNKRTTTNRSIGLVNNGVEVLSPSLFDENIYFGPLVSVNVTNEGKDYDIINPPDLEVRDVQGISAKAHVNLVGSIKKVRVISPGIGYQSKPKITISGGNGTGCILESNLVRSRISAGFRPTSDVNPSTDIITFPQDHNFDDGEEIIYYANGNSDLPGLVDQSHYYVGITSTNVTKIYNTFTEAINKTNAINITGISSGFHNLTTLLSKNTITEVYVKDGGSGYSNRHVRIPSNNTSGNSVGINTYDSYLVAYNHGFSTGEVVHYNTTDTPISGLSTSTSYYVKVLDKNSFKLSSAGVGTVASNQNLLDKKYVKFTSVGVGTHIVSYPPIEIKVESLASIGSTGLVQPNLKPIVTGSVSDVYLEDGGISYGCTNIVNYHRRPEVGFSTISSQCILKPIILNGSINDIKIINKGRGYRVDADITVVGKGKFAEVNPVIVDGRVEGFNIINGGVGYASSNTELLVNNTGSNAKFLANVYEWKINQAVKSKKMIESDDQGMIYPSQDPKFGLQYIHFYVPNKLRYQLEDNFTETNKEETSGLSHSPILGFAYDGNPIYGPYGYDPVVGGSIRQIRTGYDLQTSNVSGFRPPNFEGGYFTNDYVYTGSGDLDEHNGRYCITPQYPDGVYAYFTTINIDNTGKSTPAYPYIVGPYFKDLPIVENFIPTFTQDIDFTQLSISRNVGPYYLTKRNSYYDLIDKISDDFKQEIRVREINKAGITSVSIFSSGEGYKVDDRLVISSLDDSGSGANVLVSKLSGSEVNEFSVVKSTLTNLDFNIKGSNVEVTYGDPHEILDGESILIKGISKEKYSIIEGPKTVGVNQKTVELSSDVSTIVGYATFITVKDTSGFSVNDVIGIGTETLRITQIFPEKSMFYVNRLDGIGIHTSGDSVVLLPNKLSFAIPNSGLVTLNNETVYFDPKESVGVGYGVTRSLVGIGTSTVESRYIPAKSIYIPSHKFYTGQELKYNAGYAGTSLIVSNTAIGASFTIDNDQIVYAVNLGNDYIGISTLGFTTSSGIGTNLNSLYFYEFDSFETIGFAHSFTTLNEKVTGSLERFVGIVTTKTNHNLLDGDSVEISVNQAKTQTVSIVYNPELRKLLANKIEFTNSEVDVVNSSIDLSGSLIKTGDKVVYKSTSPISGLVDNGVYYVIKNDINEIKLCEYESDIKNTNFISFGSAGGVSQNLYFINPPINAIKNSIVEFDLSDNSLVDMDLEFYSDSKLTRALGIIGTEDGGYAITRDKDPGSADAKVTVDSRISELPNPIYYSLIPKSPIDGRKTQISFDSSVSGHNKLFFKNHVLESKFAVNVTSDKVFSVNLKQQPLDLEVSSYSEGSISYKTTSKNTSGPIDSLRINFSGKGYTKTPTVSSIQTESGKNAVIKLYGSTIGKVTEFDRVKDGFDYPTDPTLSPTLSVPSVVSIKDIRTIDYIGIVTAGNNYNYPPSLIVKDHPYIQLEAEIFGGSVSKVNIISNVNDLKSPLEITSIYNSNGYDIDFITVSGDDVTFELANTAGDNPLINSGYGSTITPFPFSVGDEVFVENCRLTLDTQSKANFNSTNYNYQFFPVTSVDENNLTITVSTTGIATGNFGTYDDERTLGYIVNKKDIPVFEMVLSDDSEYISGEKVTSDSFSAVVMENGWDNDLNQLRVSESFGSLDLGDKIFGEISKINGTVESYSTFNLNSTLGVTRDKIGQIDNSVGILNDFQQRISDNFYYQKFSYSIRGEIPYDRWRESVRSIVHPSGFKEFSDLEIYTKPTENEVSIGIARSTNLKPTVGQSVSSLLVNIDNVIDTTQRNNFAKVYEDDVLPDGSTERVFIDEGLAIRDYILNKTNKVLKIDDISGQFNGTSIQTLDGRFADGSDLLEANKAFIQEEVVGFITATYPGITTNPDWDRAICYRDVGYIVDAISHDLKYKSNNKSVEAGLAYWSGVGTSYVAGEEIETIAGFNYITQLSKYIINNVGVNTSYQLGTSIGIVTASYDNVTGVTTIGISTTPSTLGLNVGDKIVLKDLVFSCDSGGGFNTAIFPSLGNGPDGNGPLSPKGFAYAITGIGTTTTFTINPGVSTIQHTYEGGGTVQRGFITTQQYFDTSIQYDENCSPTYSENCCAGVWYAIGNYVGIITTIIGIGSTAAPNITNPSLTRGGIVVGLSSFSLTNKGYPLFKRSFDSSDDQIVKLTDDSFNIVNHNFQTGQELIYNYGSGTPIGIATTSYVLGEKDILMTVGNYNGTAVFENGYGNALTTSISGLSTVLVPAGPTNQYFNDVIGNSVGGSGATFDIIVTYSAGTGQPLSTSISLVSGGSGYSVGETVSIAGTYLGGSTPTDDLSFVVSTTAPSAIVSEADNSYSDVPSNDSNGAVFNVVRDSNGRIYQIDVVNGGSGYASTSVVSIAGTYLGGSTPNDSVSFIPTELGTNILPETLYVYKFDDGKIKLAGLSTSIFLTLDSLGTGYHSLEYKEPNASTIITIDGVIQTQIRNKSLSVSLGSSVSTATTTIINISSGISSLSPYDIINIDDEFMQIKNIEVYGSNLVGVERGFLGTQSGIHTIGAAATVKNGDYNVVGDTVYFTTPPYGKIGPVGLKTGSIFGGRVFSRKFDESTNPEDKNILFDDISLSFTGLGATEFTVKSNGSTTTALFNDVNFGSNINNNPIIMINNVVQESSTDYTVDGSSENVLRFLTGTPSAGRISKVSQNSGFGYVPFVGAAASAVVSAAGTISSIILTGIGSGYRGEPSVSIASTIGYGASVTASVSAGGTITGLTITNPGTGYTTTSLPQVVIGIPTGYSNLGVAYTGGSSGLGEGAKVSVVVGQGSSIISFKIDKPGTSYKVGDILKVQDLLINNGIGTAFEEFRFTVEEVQTDTFNGFYPGQFIRFDDISSNFNGFRRKFTLSVTTSGVKEIISLKTPKGSDLDIANNIFVYINDVLQIPGNAYTYSGSRISFTEPPKTNSTCSIYYYRGSSLDVEQVSPPKTIKEGDFIKINENPFRTLDTDQFERVVKKLVASDQFDTFTYNSFGIDPDVTNLRPLTWRKQKKDRVISGALYSKARPSLKSIIRPNATVIKPIGESDTSIYVDNAYPIFTDIDFLREDLRDILINETRVTSPAIGTCVVSSASTIVSVVLSDSGSGYAYTSSPEVSISLSAISTKDPINDWRHSVGIPTSYVLNSIDIGNTVVSVGNNSVYSITSDGINWNSGLVGYAGTIGFNAVSCGGTNSYVAVGDYAVVSRSLGYGLTIGNWENIGLLEEVIVSGAGVVAKVGTSYTGVFNDVHYVNNVDSWVAVGAGGSIFTGVGIGTTAFISKFSGVLGDMNSVTSNSSQIIAVGESGIILRSFDAIVWERLSTPTLSNLNDVIYSDGVFVAVGDGGTVIRTITPKVFELITTNVSVDFVEIKYNGFYIALDSSGNLYYSFDLSTWILRETNQSNILKDIVSVPSFGLEGRFISVGSAGTAIYSEPILNRATASASVTSGIVTSIEIINGGFGYLQSSPPPVIIEQDKSKTERVVSIKVVGDFGTIIGVNTFVAGTPGIGTTSPKIDFVLKSETYDNSTLGIGYSSLNQLGVTYSQLNKGDYFVISDSNVEIGQPLVGITTTLGGMSNYPASKVGTAVSFLDGVYIVEDVTQQSLGIVTVTCHFAPIEGLFGNYVEVYARGESYTGVNTNGFYGRYSWGKIFDYQNRLLDNPKSFEVYNDNGLSGISTNPQVFRTRGL